MYWITADTHFGHENIIKYCGRPFKNVKEMDDTMIANWNTLVKPEDTIFHLGDLVFKNSNRNLREILHGTLIHIQGNHDNRSAIGKTVIQSIRIKYGGYEFFLTHNPANIVADCISLVGHVHEKWTHKWMFVPQQYSINVGVDVWNFHPIKLDTIIKYIERNKLCKIQKSSSSS